MKTLPKKIVFTEVPYENGAIRLHINGYIVLKNKQVKDIFVKRFEKVMDNYRLSHIPENSLTKLCAGCDHARPNKLYCQEGLKQFEKVAKCSYRFPVIGGEE